MQPANCNKVTAAGKAGPASVGPYHLLAASSALSRVQCNKNNGHVCQMSAYEPSFFSLFATRLTERDSQLHAHHPAEETGRQQRDLPEAGTLLPACLLGLDRAVSGSEEHGGHSAPFVRGGL